MVPILDLRSPQFRGDQQANRFDIETQCQFLLLFSYLIGAMSTCFLFGCEARIRHRRPVSRLTSKRIGHWVCFAGLWDGHASDKAWPGPSTPF